MSRDKYALSEDEMRETIRRLQDELNEARTEVTALRGRVQQLEARDKPTVYGDGVFMGGPSGLAAARAWLADREDDGDETA